MKRGRKGGMEWDGRRREGRTGQERGKGGTEKRKDRERRDGTKWGREEREEDVKGREWIGYGNVREGRK